MLTGLLFTAFLMGLGGVPHCAAMCGAACAAAFPRGLPAATWVGRLLGYALMGAVAAVSAGAVSRWGREVAMLKPLWVMAQVVVVMLGVYLLLTGRMPAVLDGAGRAAYDSLRARWRVSPDGLPPPWRGVWRLAWPMLGGMAWALLPCGLLYAALMVAALAPGAWGGALVMLAFAVPSSMGVWAAPWVLRKLRAWRKPGGQGAMGAVAAELPVATTVPVIWLRQPATEACSTVGHDADAGVAQPADPVLVDPRWAVRASGLCLALLGGWAVWHQLVAQWQAWCA